MELNSSKAKNTGKPDQVDAFLVNLRHPMQPEIEVLRALILGADKRIKESIKWNAPSYFIDEHFATFKLHPPTSVQVVFHTGAKVKQKRVGIALKDPPDILKWVASDRCVVTFSNMQAIEINKMSFIAIVRHWIEQL